VPSRRAPCLIARTKAASDQLPMPLVGSRVVGGVSFALCRNAFGAADAAIADHRQLGASGNGLKKSVRLTVCAGMGAVVCCEQDANTVIAVTQQRLERAPRRRSIAWGLKPSLASRCSKEERAGGGAH